MLLPLTIQAAFPKGGLIGHRHGNEGLHVHFAGSESIDRGAAYSATFGHTGNTAASECSPNSVEEPTIGQLLSLEVPLDVPVHMGSVDSNVVRFIHTDTPTSEQLASRKPSLGDTSPLRSSEHRTATLLLSSHALLI